MITKVLFIWEHPININPPPPLPLLLLLIRETPVTVVVHLTHNWGKSLHTLALATTPTLEYKLPLLATLLGSGTSNMHSFILSTFLCVSRFLSGPFHQNEENKHAGYSISKFQVAAEQRERAEQSRAAGFLSNQVFQSLSVTTGTWWVSHNKHHIPSTLESTSRIPAAPLQE